MKIFIFKPDGIGDFVLASGAIRKLAENFGEKNLTIAVLPTVAQLAKFQFPDARVLALPLTGERKVLNLFVANFFQLLPTWFRLQKERFDAIVCLRHSRKYLHAFFLAALRGRKRLLCENQFFSQASQGHTNTEKVLWRIVPATVVPYPAHSHLPLELVAHQLLLTELPGCACKPEELLPRLTVSRQSSAEQKTILLCPFSSMPGKDYPAAKWLDCFRLLPEDYREIPLELAGDAAQHPALESLAAELRAAGYRFARLRSRESLVEFVHAIADARIVLTVDTAAAHLATALDRPAVILFSGLHRGVYAPWQTSSQQIWIEPEPVAPGEPPRKKSRWHNGIAPANVAATLQQLLARQIPTAGCLANLSP